MHAAPANPGEHAKLRMPAGWSEGASELASRELHLPFCAFTGQSLESLRAVLR